MKIANFLGALLLTAAGAAAGWYLAGHSTPAPEPAASDGGRQVLYYRNPMNPAIHSDRPAKDEMGMEYIPVYAGEEEEGSAVTLSPAVINNLGVRTARVERAELARRIDTVGYVDYDEDLISHVHLRTEGWIDRLAVRSLGERVQAGQLLFELYSPGLVYAQQELLQALESNNPRLVSAGRDKLAALGVSPGEVEAVAKGRQVHQRVKIYARQDGTLSELNVREGMFVKPDAAVMSIADLSRVWLLAEVFESQAGWVQVGQRAEVRLAAFPGEVWHGQVEYLYPSLEPATRTLKLRLRFDNPGERLKPNMYAAVTLLADPHPAALAIPREALIRSGDGERVIKAVGGGAFAAAEVHSGIESGERVEIVTGLQEGDVVVTSAQFLIDSEASLKASVARMTPPQEVQEPRRAADGVGRLDAVDETGRKVTVSHDPIAALGWPTMKMDFELADGVSAAGLAPGDRIAFTVEEAEEYRYLLTRLEKEAKP